MFALPGTPFILSSLLVMLLFVLVYWVMDRVDHYSQAQTTLCCALGLSTRCRTREPYVKDATMWQA